MKVKGLTEINFNHSDGHKTFRSLRIRTYSMLFHFQNYGAAVECITLVLLP